MSYYNYYLDFIYCVPQRQIVMVLPDDFMFASPPFLPPALLSSPGRRDKAAVCGRGQLQGGEWCGRQRSANHLFTFGICIMRQRANGSPDWLETGWHAFSFNGHAEETSNPS